MPWISVGLIEIEGMAMNGLVESVKLEDCREPKGWKRIVAVDREGRTLASKCIEPEAARRNYMVLTLYSKKWGSLIFSGEEVIGRPEEE
ncbi:hypothetical protein [Stetteria hydrogenophila]